MPEATENTKSLEDRIQELHDSAATIVAKLDKGDGSDHKSLKDELDKLQAQILPLEEERVSRQRDNEMKGLRTQVESLQGALNQLREPDPGTVPGPGKSVADEIYGPTSQNSYFMDILSANKGDTAARERMQKALDNPEGKAMTESLGANAAAIGAAGGYLVPTQIANELIRLRTENSQLRPLFSSVQVNGLNYQIPAVTGGLTAASWVAEMGTKPASDLTFGQISASVFTAAHLAVASNQILQDSRPGVDGLITEELARRLTILEEQAFIDGDGTGKPLGILGTSGILTVALTSTAILDLTDAILQAISDVESNTYESPNAIVMHPRTWTRIVKARESGTAAQYIIGDGANSSGRRASDGRPSKSLFGIPVITTSNIPTNKGGTTNESRVIVGNFREGLILDHTGITIDESPHVYFTTNATVFRGETRVGFTAARYPKAFAVIAGAGLAAG